MNILSVPDIARVEGFWASFSRSIDKSFIFHGETHDFYELIFLLEGKLSFVAGATTFSMEAPAAILYPPMEFHNLHATEDLPAKVIFLGFDASAMPKYKELRFSITEEDVVRAKKILNLTAEPLGAYFEGNSLSPTQNKCLFEAAKELEMLLLVLCERDAVHKKDRSSGAKNYALALRIIDENLSSPLDTVDLAHKAHISPSLLKKTFSGYAGMGVMQYVRKRKINAAILRLREGERVKEVAASLGFSDPSYFSTVFRRVTGHSPTYYRNH